MIAFLMAFLLSTSLHAGCINRDEVALKATIGKRAPLSWKVRKYTPLKKLGEPYNGWVRVRDLEGDKHWVKQKDFTEKYHCVMIKNDSTMLKVGPGDKYNDKFKEPAEKYETFRFLKAKKGWVHVRDVHGDTGWLKYSDVWTD